MWTQRFTPQAHKDEASRLAVENHTLRLQVSHLDGQIYALSGQISNLQVENARLRALLQPLPPPTNNICTMPSDNTFHLPAVIESLEVMRDHFQRQGTLKRW